MGLCFVFYSIVMFMVKRKPLAGLQGFLDHAKAFIVVAVVCFFLFTFCFVCFACGFLFRV